MAQSLICYLGIPTPLAFRPTIEIDFAQHSGFPRSSDDLLAWAKDAMITDPARSCSWPGGGSRKSNATFSSAAARSCLRIVRSERRKDVLCAARHDAS